jgi:hypothetical protein
VKRSSAPAETETTIAVPQLSLRADVVAQSVNEEARTVELIFSTGAAVERFDWMSGKRYLEKLSLDPSHVRLDRLNAGGPLLDAHSAWSVTDQLGAVVPGTVVIAKKQARATVRFSKRAEVESIWQDVRDGIIRNVSVGYRVHKFEETEGKNNALPVRNAIDWEPYEVSMVPMGADVGARVRSGDNVQTYPCVLITRGQEEEMKENEQERAGAPEPKPAAPAAAPAPAQTPAAQPTADEVRAAAIKDERERTLAIRKAVGVAKLPTTFADGLVERGVTIDAARASILEELAKAQPAVDGAQRTDVLDDASDKARRGFRAWLLVRAGMSGLIAQAAKALPEHAAFKGVSTDAGEFRGMTLVDMARESLELAGVRTRGMDRMRVAELALRHSGAGNTSSDFVVALENTLHKILLAAYMITPDTWRRFCATGSVNDFRDHPRYRTGYLGRLDKILESGEFKNKSIPDATKEKIAATTSGNILALSRQAIVNDDMDVFSRVAGQLGRAAALSIEMDVYDLLALNAGLGPTMNDGNTLFHATHNNLGAGAALSVASIDADRVVLASQKDAQSNEILDLRPAVMVIPIGLGGQARVINQAQYDTDIVANKPHLVPNKVVGLFRDVVDTPRLTGTRRYMFADPALMPVIEVAFLEGVQEPFLEAKEGWRTDGVEWKARLDYGVAAVEFRGAVTNAGV